MLIGRLSNFYLSEIYKFIINQLSEEEILRTTADFSRGFFKLLIQKYLDDVISFVAAYDKELPYMILGYLIISYQAMLPKRLKKIIIRSFSSVKRDLEDLGVRDFTFLNDFKQILKNYRCERAISLHMINSRFLFYL